MSAAKPSDERTQKPKQKYEQGLSLNANDDATKKPTKPIGKANPRDRETE